MQQDNSKRTIQHLFSLCRKDCAFNNLGREELKTDKKEVLTNTNINTAQTQFETPYQPTISVHSQEYEEYLRTQCERPKKEFPKRKEGDEEDLSLNELSSTSSPSSDKEPMLEDTEGLIFKRKRRQIEREGKREKRKILSIPKIREETKEENNEENKPSQSSSSSSSSDFSRTDKELSFTKKTNYSLMTKKWFITLFSYKKEDIEKWFQYLKEEIKSCCCCEDLTKSNNKYHIHIAVIFKRHSLKLADMEKMFALKPNNFEKLEGTYSQAREYILGKKDGADSRKKPFIDFNPPAEKKLPVSEEFWLAVQEDPRPENVIELLEEKKFAVMIPQLKTALDFCRYCNRNFNSLKIVVVYYYGPAGSGKTYLAYHLFSSFKIKSQASFSPAGQLVGVKDMDECVFFDDLPAGDPHLNHEFLFRLLDKYPMVIDVKSSTRIYHPKLVLITRVEKYTEFCKEYGWKETDQTQLARRITITVRCSRVEKADAPFHRDNHPEDFSYYAFDEENHCMYSEEKIMRMLRM